MLSIRHFVTAVLGYGTIASAVAVPKSLYGPDNRRDLVQAQNPSIFRLAQSVVGLVDDDRLHADALTSRFRFDLTLLQEVEGLCMGERFGTQPTLPHCTGVIVAPSVILTAGHCFDTDRTCATTRVILDWRVNAAGAAPGDAAVSQVYACQEMLAREMDGDRDYALFRLNRPIQARTAIRIPARSSIQPGSGVFAIGHPSGLPLKSADDARAMRFEERTFFASLDTFQGNSGSPVFNARTLELEGLLIEGGSDYVERPETVESENSCRITAHCEDGGCDGETVLKSAFIGPIVRRFLR